MSIRAQVDRLIADAQIVQYGDISWIDLAGEWPGLPTSMKAASDKWSRRLSKLKIGISLCRFTEYGKIDKQLEDGVKCKKSVYCPCDIFKQALTTLATKRDTAPQASQSDLDVQQTGVSHATSPRQTSGAIREVSEISLGLTERFTYEGTPLNIKLYGSRTPDELLVDFKDAFDAVGVRMDNVPREIRSLYVLVNGEHRQVMTFSTFLIFVGMKSGNFPIASELHRWVTAVIFGVQYGDNAQVAPQSCFAVRDCKSSNAMYGATEGDREVLYLLDVCSAAEAAKTFPDQIHAALPHGKSLSTFHVVKAGCSEHEQDRVVSNRSSLRNIFPGCDPRPIQSTPFPQTSKKELVELERIVFQNDFDIQKIRGIVHNGSEQDELYLFEAIDVQVARNSMSSSAYRHTQNMIKCANDRAKQAEETLSMMEKEMAALQVELQATRKTALKVMPPETADIISTFWNAKNPLLSPTPITGLQIP